MKKFFSRLTLCMIFTAVSLLAFSSQAAAYDTYYNTNDASDSSLCTNGQAHKFSAWVTVTPSGCTTKGLQTRTCSVCGKSESQNTNALGHSYSTEWTIDVDATCVSLGSKSHHCIRCDAKTDVTRIDYGGHKYGSWSLVTAATCTNDGLEKRNCIYCGEVETRSVMRLGHKETVSEAIDPTCVLNGKTQGIYCATCGYVIIRQEDVPALGHDVVVDPYVEPTCTANGKSEGSHCARCKLVLEKQEIIDAKGHVIVDDEEVPATCETAGKIGGKHCEVCGLVTEKPEITPALGHRMIETVTKKTCTTDGYTTHECTLCGYSYRDHFDYAKGHTEAIVKQIKETCTKSGMSVKTYCSVCGLVFTDSQVIPATGHQPKTATVAATTKKNGSKTVACSVCGIKISSSTIAKIGSVKLSATSYVYDGKAKKPTVTIKDANGKKLKSGTDYKVTYDSGRKKCGTYYVTVTFKGDYSGKKTLKFKIKLAQTKSLKITAKSKSAVLKWSKTKGATKYEIYYSTSKTGKYKKLTTVKSNSVTAKKLKSGKVYYFKVRAVTTDAGGSTTRGAFSSIQKAKVK